MPTIEVTGEQAAAIEAAGIIDRVEPLNDLDGLVGKKLLIRTVTNYFTGEVIGRVGGFLELADAAWIADTGRFADAITTGKLNEVEPIGRTWVSTGAVVDFTEWNHPLPKDQK